MPYIMQPISKQLHHHQHYAPAAFGVYSLCSAQLSKQQHLSLALCPPLSRSIDILSFMVLLSPPTVGLESKWMDSNHKGKNKTDIDSQGDWGVASHHFSQRCFASGKRPCEAFNHWSAEESRFSSLPSHKMPCRLLMMAFKKGSLFNLKLCRKIFASGGHCEHCRRGKVKAKTTTAVLKDQIEQTVQVWNLSFWLNLVVNGLSQCGIHYWLLNVFGQIQLLLLDGKKCFCCDCCF